MIDNVRTFFDNKDALTYYCQMERHKHPPLRKPMHWRMAVNYPKRAGPIFKHICDQHITRQVGALPGDTVTFHEGDGSPWRLDATVTEVEELHLMDDELEILTLDKVSYVVRWTDPLANYIANKEFLVPGTGLELKRVLAEMFPTETHFEIIHWDPVEAYEHTESDEVLA